jgi:DNA-directed RNA polymerase specialized sigma24 family protein
LPEVFFTLSTDRPHTTERVRASEGQPDEDCLALERIQCGDSRAMAGLYDRHAGVIYSMALRVLKESPLAEQVVSDIFLEIWRDPAHFMQIGQSFCPSMVMLAHRRAVAMLLHKPDAGFEFPSLPNYGGSPFVSLTHWKMTPEEACEAIAKLPAERRTFLEKLFFQATAEPGTGEDVTAVLEPAARPSISDVPQTVSEAVARLAGTGLEVIDVENDAAFARRRLHVRDFEQHIDGMNRLAQVFAESPERVLEQLVTAAVELCGADSAGISIEQPDGADDNFYRWAATAGQYSGFVNAKLPRYPSACGVTIERGRPQIFRVAQRFFDLMGVQAPTVTDGLLLPWQVDGTRGTIWIMAHGRQEAFDSEDCRMMQALASFAATGVRLMQQQKQLMDQARAAAETAMAVKIARQIDIPLQGLIQSVVLLGRGGQDSSVFAQRAMSDIARLTELVNRNVSLPN